MKYTLSALLSLTICTMAQTPVKPQPVPPVPAAEPRVAPKPGQQDRVEAIKKRGERANNNNSRVDPNGMAATANAAIDGSNWDDQDVADAYTSYTGKRVLLSSATQALEIRFFQRGPLTNAEAAVLLDKTLNMEGFAFVPSGVNEVKLLPKAQGTGANAPADTEIMVDDPANIPSGDEYISYFMKLDFMKPEDAVRTFTQSLHGLGPGAKIAPVPNASAVIVTGKSSFIRKLINQKHYIDVAAGNVDTKWMQMQYADAEEVATTLNEIMNSQQQRNTTAGVTTGGANRGNNNARRANTPPVPGNNAAAASGSSGAATSAGEEIPVQIVADPRQNSIFIMGRPVDILFLERIAREFDAPPNKSNFYKRRLHFMLASDFLDVAESALSSVGGAIGGGQGQGGGGGGRQNNGNQGGGNNGGGGGGGQNSSGAESVEEFNVSDVPEARVIGKTLLVADNLANSILVQGPPESIRIVSELVDKLDGRPQQVMISTVFGQITVAEGTDIGVSIGGLANDGGNGIAGNSSTAENGISDLLDIGTLTDVAGLAGASAAGLNIYGAVDNFNATLRALEANSDFKVLSRPTVYTSNNRRALISSGSRIAVPTNTFNSGGTGVASQSTNIEFRDVLLRFEVVPLINSEDEVTLRISLLNEDTVGFQTIDGNNIPTIVTDSIATTVTVKNNSTVVLGGLVTETISKATTGVPVLSSIPGLGRLFRRDDEDVERRELLIFIQPKIILDDISQQAAQDDINSRYIDSDATRDFAAGVLPSKPATKVKKKRSRDTVKEEAATQTATKKKSRKPKLAVPAASKRPGRR